MTLSHDQASLRLVDFLYETLPEEEHAAVAAHLATCPSCAAEVGGWKQVRATAGAALRGRLDEPPPSHLRAAILAAAEQVERAQREKARAVSPASAASVQAKPSKSGSGGGSRSGWWEHWRKAWVVPAFAMAAVFCLFVISRNTLFRSRLGDDVASEQVKAWEKAAPAVAPAPAAAPAASAPATEPTLGANAQPPSNEEEKAIGAAKSDDGAGTGRAASTTGSATGKRHAAESDRRRGASPPGASAGSVGFSPDPQANLKAGRLQEKKSRSAPMVAPQDKAPAGPARDRLAPEKDEAAPAKRKFAEPPPPAPAALSVSAPSRPSPSRSASSSAPAPLSGGAAAAKPKAKGASVSSPGTFGDDLLEGAVTHSAVEKRPQAAAPPTRAPAEPAPATAFAPAPAPAPPPPTSTSRAEREGAAASPAAPASGDLDNAEAESPSSFAKSEESASAHRPTPGSLDDRLKKAERALATRDWSTAARGYRDLIRLFPSDPRVPDWKNKALIAERASVGR